MLYLCYTTLSENSVGATMSIVKIILRKKKNSKGELPSLLPLTLRITKDRKTSFIYLGHSIKETDWDESNQRVKKSHPNSTRLNNFLLKKLSDANAKALELETDNDVVSVKAVKSKIKPKAGSTFFNQASTYIANLKLAGKYNQYTSDKARLNNFKKFIGHDIAFSDITPSLLERFNAYARSTLKLSERSASNQLVTIRSVFSHAIKDKVIDAKHYPFGRGKMKIKFPDSIKIGLTTDEVKSLEKTNLDDPAHEHARNLWLFSFYFAGIRVSDVFRMRWSDIQDNRLHYAMGKNNKAGSLKIPEKALAILKQYKASKATPDGLIFPELKGCNLDNKFLTQRTIAFKTSTIDKILRKYVAPAAGIEKKLTMHLARHTFGNLSGDKIPIQMLQKLYRHSSITTTIGYQGHFIHKEADEALDSVLFYENETRYTGKKKNAKGSTNSI